MVAYLQGEFLIYLYFWLLFFTLKKIQILHHKNFTCSFTASHFFQSSKRIFNASRNLTLEAKRTKTVEEKSSWSSSERKNIHWGNIAERKRMRKNYLRRNKFSVNSCFNVFMLQPMFNACEKFFIHFVHVMLTFNIRSGAKTIFFPSVCGVIENKKERIIVHKRGLTVAKKFHVDWNRHTIDSIKPHRRESQLIIFKFALCSAWVDSKIFKMQILLELIFTFYKM